MIIHFFTSNVPHHNGTLIRFLSKIGVEQKNRIYYLGENDILDYTRCASKLEIAIKAVLLSREHTIIFHGQFNPYVWLFLWMGLIRADAVRWIIWGGDLYPAHNRGLLHKAYNLLKKKAAQKITFVYGFMEDCRYFKEEIARSGSVTAKRIFHPTPVNMPLIQRLKNSSRPTDSISVLIGNSAELTNNFQEALEKLGSYRQHKIQVVFPFSYGPKGEEHEQAVNWAKSLFGPENVVVLTDFMNQEQFLQFLSSVDIVVYANNRQEGVGTLISALLLNKKIYLKNHVSTSREFKELGLEIFDFDELGKVDFEVFKQPPEHDRNPLYAELLTEVGMFDVWKKEFSE